MRSLFDDLTEKLNQDPRLTRRGGPRVDLSLFLFNNRESLRELWLAADRAADSADPDALLALRKAVDNLRSIFGERT